MRQLASILLTLIVINPFCACGAVRGDAHTVEKVTAATACGHDHCEHEESPSEAPCDCDHHVDFLSPLKDTLSAPQPMFTLLDVPFFAPGLHLDFLTAAVRSRAVQWSAEEPRPASALWQHHCVLLL